jgi:predicted ATPase
MVVTSWRALDVLGERQIHLPPLAFPPLDADLSDIAAAPAVRLLTDRLVDHGGSADPDDLQQLAVIARRLDGLPLALELVAAHASTHTVAELVSLIDEPLELSAPDRDRDDRHRRFPDTLLWSVDRLDAEHRAVLRRLGCSPAPSTSRLPWPLRGPAPTPSGWCAIWRARHSYTSNVAPVRFGCDCCGRYATSR